MSYFNQLISTNPSIREAAIANGRASTYAERRIIKRLGKRRMEMVEEVCEDESVFEVILKPGFINNSYCETMWVFGKHHIECGDYTLTSMIEQDLMHWMNGVEEVTL